MSLKITFLKAFFNLSKNNETNIYKENTEHRESLAKAARVLKEYIRPNGYLFGEVITLMNKKTKKIFFYILWIYVRK